VSGLGNNKRRRALLTHWHARCFLSPHGMSINAVQEPWMSNESPQIDHAFVGREAGDAPMLPRHRALHERLRQELGPRYHAELLRTLAPELRVSDEQANELWVRILRHQRELSHRLGRHASISVAALDYLHQVVGALHHPVLVSEAHHDTMLRRSHTPREGVAAVTIKQSRWARWVTRARA